MGKSERAKWKLKEYVFRRLHFLKVQKVKNFKKCYFLKVSMTGVKTTEDETFWKYHLGKKLGKENILGERHQSDIFTWGHLRKNSERDTFCLESLSKTALSQSSGEDFEQLKAITCYFLVLWNQINQFYSLAFLYWVSFVPIFKFAD